MNKKTIMQLVISMVFFGITVYVMYSFFYKDTENDKRTQLEDESSVKELNIDSLLNRNFQTEQIDIFEKESFKNLKDNSVEIPDSKRLKIGRDNPFEPTK